MEYLDHEIHEYVRQIEISFDMRPSSVPEGYPLFFRPRCNLIDKRLRIIGYKRYMRSAFFLYVPYRIA